MLKKTLLATVLALTLPLAFAAVENENDRWKLSDIYADRAAWQADIGKLDAQIKEFKQCQGQLGKSVASLKKCLQQYTDIAKRNIRINSYSQQLLDQDTGEASSMEMTQLGEAVSSRADEALSFVRPEILKIGAARMQKLIAQDKELLQYRHALDQILRAAPHTLDQKGEQLIAAFGPIVNSAGAAYSIFSNADMPWPKVKLSNGEEVTIDQSAYTKYRAENKRADRKLVFDAFWGKWKEFERTFGVTFYEMLKKDSVMAKVRNHPDSLTDALFANRLPVAVYDQLITQVNQNLPTLHRYFKLRAKLLGVTDLGYHDIYPALLDTKIEYPIEMGKKLMIESARPLGADYVAGMQKGLQDRWMDVYPRPRKRSGAYMNGAVYDVHPFVLMNYNNDYESVSTLAHEWGHAMHSWLANRSQTFINADYPIFTAEIASTTNEGLLLDYMLKQAKSDDERLLYLGSSLENFRGTFFRQAMFADFERTVHARADKGEALTGAELSKIYLDLLRRYHGEKEGVMKIDEKYGIEWAYIPHFYNRFYVFQYATSISAGTMFADQILSGKPGAVERYLGILKAGGSQYPYELVKGAGVDLASPAPYQAVVKRMNAIMDEMETILARRAKK
ncbi:oligoendopeptidase F [Massilia sp. W12]|uniref:oligoendopeptidase F n=1 Tax=Massilia sp. W12 TaxID=3126507 RepID=UPI0030CF4273